MSNLIHNFTERWRDFFFNENIARTVDRAESASSKTVQVENLTFDSQKVFFFIFSKRRFSKCTIFEFTVSIVTIALAVLYFYCMRFVYNWMTMFVSRTRYICDKNYCCKLLTPPQIPCDIARLS